LEDVKIVFGDKKFILYWPDWSIDEFRMIYPEKAGTQFNINNEFNEEAFKRSFSTVAIQKSDSGLVEIPVTINDVLKIYAKLGKTDADITLSKDIAQTLIQTKTLGFKEWEDGNYYEFIDANKPFRQPHAFLIKKLTIGNEELHDVRAVISESLSQSMYINMSVLERIGKINIDLNKELLTITKK
jgi:predicted aspartyl protease